MCFSSLYVAMYAKEIITVSANKEAKRLLEVSEFPDSRSLKNFLWC